ncbi:MAG: type VI secretion system baseplate subunit TssG [Janthinobacterium lividum]
MFDSAATTPVYLLDQLGLDYRPEVVAAGLLAADDHALKMSRLIFKPTGPITRPYAKDAGAPQLLATEGPAEPYLLLDTPREGLYDQLPPFLFHAIPATAGPAPEAEVLLAQLRHEREIEQETRRFFLPFDTELYYLRLLRYERERQADQLAEAPVLCEEFSASWPILRRLDPPTASLFIQVLPFIHQLRGNVEWLGRFLAVVLGVPVRFETEQPIVHQVAATDAPGLALGQCRLGINALAGSTFSDGYNATHLHLGPVPASRVAEFLPGSAARTLLAELLDYFMPAFLEVRLFVSIERAAPGEPTAEAAPPPTTYLGYNSFLLGNGSPPRGEVEPRPYYFLTNEIFPVVTGLRQRWPAWSRRLAWRV